MKNTFFAIFALLSLNACSFVMDKIYEDCYMSADYYNNDLSVDEQKAVSKKCGWKNGHPNNQPQLVKPSKPKPNERYEENPY